MAEENIFTGDNQPSPEPTQDPQGSKAPENTFQVPQELSELIGEGKKYATVEDALRSIPHAQQHIQTLETENATYKEDLSKRQTTEELIASIKADNTQLNDNSQQQSLDINDITQVVDQRVSAIEAQKAQKANQDAVAKAFIEKFGDKAEETYNKLAAENGLSVQDLNNLGARSPNAVIKLAGLGNEAPIVQKQEGTVNTEGKPPVDNTPKTSKLPVNATSQDIKDAWKRAGEIVQERLNS